MSFITSGHGFVKTPVVPIYHVLTIMVLFIINYEIHLQCFFLMIFLSRDVHKQELYSHYRFLVFYACTNSIDPG